MLSNQRCHIHHSLSCHYSIKLYYHIGTWMTHIRPSLFLLHICIVGETLTRGTRGLAERYADKVHAAYYLKLARPSTAHTVSSNSALSDCRHISVLQPPSHLYSDHPTLYSFHGG